MNNAKVKNIGFTSLVAIYGLYQGSHNETPT